MAFHYHDGLDPEPFIAFIRETLDRFDGNVVAVATYLGFSARVIQRWRDGQNSDGDPIEKVREKYVDQACTAAGYPMALLYPQFVEEAVAIDRYCHHCEEWTLTGEDLKCPWCELTTYSTEGRRPGKALNMSEEVLLEARRLYEADEAITLGDLGRHLLHRTRYKDAWNLTCALGRQFRKRGWPIRAQAEVAARMRREAATRPRCQHVFAWGKRAGERCQEPVRRDGLCRKHVPEEVEARISHLRSLEAA